MKPDQDLVAIVAQQEDALIFPSFTASDAWELGNILRSVFLDTTSASNKAAGVVLSIELFSGLTLFRAVVGNDAGVSPDNWRWVERKVNVVKRFSKSSFAVGRSMALKGRTLADLGLSDVDLATHGGAFPIRVKGVPQPIGCVVVSGLPQDEDHQLAVSAIAQFLQINNVPNVL